MILVISDNPFRQPLRRKNVTFKTTVRLANADGKDGGGNTDFAINDEYLWIAFDFSVPLAWIREVEPLGPGFVVTWENPLENGQESAAFCILKSGWGYNTKKRDELMGRVRDAFSKAAARPVPQKIAVVEMRPGCQKCGDDHPYVFDFEWFTCFLVHFINKSDRRVLCARHGASRLRLATLYNTIFGNLGLGVFVSPVISWRNIRGVRAAGAISAPEAAIWMALASWPYLLIAWMLGWVVWFVIKF